MENDSLDVMKQEIIAELEQLGMAAFYGETRAANEDNAIFWDTTNYPDFRGFLRCAAKLGVPMVVLHSRTFRDEEIEDAMQDLDESAVEGEEREEMARSLREMNAFAGQVGAVDVSFGFEGHVYFYYVESDWYREFLDLRDEIDVMTFRGENTFESDDEDPLGGYFSRN
jgi:sugar phosphate isomerase/epimerase